MYELHPPSRHLPSNFPNRKWALHCTKVKHAKSVYCACCCFNRATIVTPAHRAFCVPLLNLVELPFNGETSAEMASVCSCENTSSRSVGMTAV